MKLIFAQNKHGLTQLDVLVALLLTVLLFMFLFAVFLPPFVATRQRQSRIVCQANLRQISTDLRVWDMDRGNANGLRRTDLESIGHTTGFNEGQIGWIRAMGISNIVRFAKILQCPFDKATLVTTNTAGLKIRISYFLNLDANEEYPQQLLSGDDNLVLGKPGEREPVEGFVGPGAEPGILLISTNTLVSWTQTRHVGHGNISLADGSVAAVSSIGLQNAVRYSLDGTPFSTNRIAIP